MRHAVLLAAFAWTISLTPPANPKPGVETPLQATVTDEKGKPVKNAKLQMAVTMVDMDHGETKHDAKESGPGAYDAKAQFFMAGTWNVKVTAEKGKEKAVKDFKIDVKE